MSNNKTFIATTGSGLALAAENDSGRWSVEHLLQDHDVRCLVQVPGSPRIIYAGTQGNGILRSEDNGRTWLTAGLEGQIIKSLAVNPHDPQVVYAGTTPPCVFVTHDGGQSWHELESFRRIRFRNLWRSPAEPPDFRAYVQALSISPTNPDIIVAGIEFGAVVRSADGGRTWSNHRKGALRDCHTMTFHAHNGSWVYEAGGSGRGAAVSNDGGITWQQPKEGLGRRYGMACAADPQRPEVWYISAGDFAWKGTPQVHIDGQANAYIYRKSGGSPWERLSGGLPQPLDYMAYALVTDRAASGHLYAGLSNGQIWHTQDYGDNWAQLPVNLKRINTMHLLLPQSLSQSHSLSQSIQDPT